MSFDEATKNEQFDVAKTIIAELNNDEQTFEELVLTYSDDFGSKDNGGDLGFTDGSVFPEEFENELSKKYEDPFKE